MKAAIVREAGRTPVYADFADPAPEAGEEIVAVAAAALSPLVRSRASGAHYSVKNEFPFVVGVDGVGRLDDGRRVYFVLPRPPLGSMAERTAVSAERCIAVPDDLDDVTAAAIANPGMSCWAALALRAKLKPGETVLVNGATGSAGRLSIQVARYLGATRVVATGRNPDALQTLGADATIPLETDEAALDKRFGEEFAAGVDVVVDYLWGRSAERMLIAAAKSRAEGLPVRFVQVGSASGADIVLPGAALRAAAIELMGSGIGSVSVEGLIGAIGEVFRAARQGGFEVATRVVPLAEVERAWEENDGGRRTVFTVEAPKS